MRRSSPKTRETVRDVTEESELKMSILLLRLPSVMAVTGLKKTQLFEAVKAGKFPKPVQILAGGRAIGWVEAEINAYLTARVAARDADVAKPEPPLPSRRGPGRPLKAVSTTEPGA
jgi:prophage regulatory protein